MAYKGYVKNGVIVLDELTPLTEGMRVTVLPAESEPDESSTSLRGTPYRFDDPFTPATDADDLDASR